MKLFKSISLILLVNFSINAQELPKFKSEKANAYVKAYNDFSTSYIKTKGNPENLATTLRNLSEQGKTVFKDLNPDDSKKLSDYIEGVFKKLNEVPVEKSSKNKAIEKPLENRKPLSSVSGVSVPSFKGKELNNYVQEYAHYINDYLALKGEYSEAIEKKAETLTEKAKAATQNISDADAKKLTTFMEVINKKIAKK